MRVVCTEQKTKDWFKARLGKVTASNVWRAVSTLSRQSKNGVAGDPSGEQNTYMDELELEILSGAPLDHWVSEEMDKGAAREPMAREEYAFRHADYSWETTGFILHPTMDRFGASPDLLVNADGGAEFKCPKPNTHVGYVRAYLKAKKAGLTGNDLALAVIPMKYIFQIQSNILCAEANWWDWASFCPPDPEDDNQLPDRPYLMNPVLPEKMRWLELTWQRDDEHPEYGTKAIEAGVSRFNERLLEHVEQMREVMG